MLLITRVHWPSSIFLMTDPSGCWMLGKNPRWSIGLQLCANAVSTETRTLVSVFLVCHFMCLLWTHRDTKIQSWMFGPRVKCFHCWPANPLNFSTAGLLHRTPVHFAEGTLRNFCVSYVYIYIYICLWENVMTYFLLQQWWYLARGYFLLCHDRICVKWDQMISYRQIAFFVCIFVLGEVHEVHRVKGGRS